jgi:tol-pal system protein YbgF
MKQQLLTLAGLIIFSVSTSSCLKTRAQLKEESDEDQKPIPAQVQDVQPQGQYVIDELKSELTRLNGRIEELERTQKQASASDTLASKEDLKQLDKRTAELEKAQATMIEAIKKLEQLSPTSDPQELLEKGRAEFNEGKFEAAIQTLTTYLAHPKTKKTEEAAFLRAEAYYNLKDYKKAIADYSKFPEKYTKSSRMPLALFKIAQSFEALGMKDDAKTFYQELVDKFPKSPEAKKAKPKAK